MVSAFRTINSNRLYSVFQNTPVLSMAIISQPDSVSQLAKDLICAEFPQFLLSAIDQAGYDNFFMHINPTTPPIDNFHNPTLLIKVVTACSPKSNYFAIRP